MPASGVRTNPNVPNTATYPRVSAAEQRTARPTAAAGPPVSPATSTDR